MLAVANGLVVLIPFQPSKAEKDSYFLLSLISRHFPIPQPFALPSSNSLSTCNNLCR
eukprot:Seg1174.2 transcript_id=Seg1174.2/GoldUCD/mRNA.D3Y31 product="hypothetical protein" protein_id=Seg1174.2/GoldUCD/D3Y31